MPNTHSVIMIAVIAVITAFLRFLPFIIFRSNKRPPEFILWLGRVLPYAIMGMLVVYCLKGINILSAPYGLPELIACIIVVLLHIWRRNSALSIGAGTVIYMVLVQFIF